ncbi:hypothetical protein ElyMa_000709600 [Elysia marginata]|uniref:EMI domain-containing protein n=1 Tax=Elysia marginata TaxID=1093978 RepID=A0AAV4GNM2_9GAST|nr:hypothetical protein ElyMa_000709600 [Elysia marginata]
MLVCWLALATVWTSLSPGLSDPTLPARRSCPVIKHPLDVIISELPPLPQWSAGKSDYCWAWTLFSCWSCKMEEKEMKGWGGVKSTSVSNNRTTTVGLHYCCRDWDETED